MLKNNENKKRAFTLIEIVVVMGLVGVMIAILLSTLNMNRVKEKETALLSGNFYQAIQNAVIHLAMNKKLADTDDNGEFSIEEYGAYFTKKLEGEKEDSCEIFQGKIGEVTQDLNEEEDETTSTGGSDEEEDLTQDMVCTSLNSGIIAGFYYKPECDLKVNVYEYLDLDIEEDERKPRHIENACGLIVYAIEQNIKGSSAGILGKNIFSIATTNKNIKYK